MPGFLLEDGNEFFADSLALALRVFDLREFAEEKFGSVDGVDVKAKLAAQLILGGWKRVYKPREPRAKNLSNKKRATV